MTNEKNSKKSSSAKTKKDTGLVSPNDKEAIMSDLKETMHQMGRIPGIILAPIVAFIGKKYETIPKERRDKLHSIVKEMKEHSDGAMAKLKDWFQSIGHHDETTKTKAKTKKVATKKTTTPKTITTKQAKNSTIDTVSTTVKKTASTVATKTRKVATKATKSAAKSAKKTASTAATKTKKAVTTNVKRPTQKKTTNTKKPRTTKKIT